jgi:hypothetical protein
MNERFKELAAQAGILCKPRQLLDDDCPNGYLVSDKDHADDNWQEVRAFFDGGLDKFAELIVKDCLAVIGKDRRAQLDKGDLGTARVIQLGAISVIKHFGIKE